MISPDGLHRLSWTRNYNPTCYAGGKRKRRWDPAWRFYLSLPAPWADAMVEEGDHQGITSPSLYDCLRWYKTLFTYVLDGRPLGSPHHPWPKKESLPLFGAIPSSEELDRRTNPVRSAHRDTVFVHKFVAFRCVRTFCDGPPSQLTRVGHVHLLEGQSNTVTVRTPSTARIFLDRYLLLHGSSTAEDVQVNLCTYLHELMGPAPCQKMYAFYTGTKIPH